MNEMKGRKNPVRTTRIGICESAVCIGKSALRGAVAVVITASMLSSYGCNTRQEHHSDVHEEDAHAHEESSLVRLSAEEQKAAGIESRPASRKPVVAPIESTAVIELNGDRVANISARATGRLVRIAASQGDAVQAHQPLAYFDSPELGQAWADYSKAKGRVDVSRKNLEREETLFEKKVSPGKDVLRATQDLAEAQADLAFAHEKFHLLGVDIDQYEKGDAGEGHPLIAITSPISGVVLDRAATQGEVVGPDKTLFTVADLSSLWVVIDIYEKDIARVMKGTAVKVKTTAYPEESFRGRISYVGDVMDETTRTVKARVEVENGKRRLKPGMFGVVAIEAGGGEAELLILVPEEAVLMDGKERFVFVKTGTDAFERRDVLSGRHFGRDVEIVEGLEESDHVVVGGAFTLKSEIKKEELSEEGHGH